MQSESRQVYAAINAVQLALSKVGIAKDRTNTQGQTYKFRGIDDVYNCLSPLLAEHKLCILPRMVSRQCVERLSKNGGNLFYVTVEAEFDFVSAVDGSVHVVRTFGEAMDSGDKATNKAMSAAYKYAAFQAFAIPTEGDNDADAHTHALATAEEQYAALCLKWADSIQCIKDGIAEGRLSTAAEAWFELDDETKGALWKAPSKGGVFTTKEREIMRTAEFKQAYYGVDK